MYIIIEVDGEVFNSEILSHSLNNQWQSSELFHDLLNHITFFNSVLTQQYSEADYCYSYCWQGQTWNLWWFCGIDDCGIDMKELFPFWCSFLVIMAPKNSVLSKRKKDRCTFHSFSFLFSDI